MLTGHLLQFTVSATDPDGDTLTYSASNLPPGATFDSHAQIFSWTPQTPGTFSGIQFTVSDGITDPVMQTITITVVDASLFHGEILFGMSVFNADNGGTIIDLGEGSEAKFSPDGNKVVFVSSGNIYLINNDGSNKVQLGAGDSPTWSPDGRKILFVKSNNIFIMNADGSNQADLGTGSSPVWLPDGGKILFIRSNNFYTMNADGSNVVQLTNQSSSGIPSFNAQGTKMMYVSNSQLWLANSDGSNPVKIADSAMIPIWSPDGTKIAFFDGHVNICNLNGSITASSPLFASFGFQLKWTPDSQSVGYIGTSQRSLEVLYLDGHERGISATVSSFAFSPDSQWVCYAYDVRNGVFISSLDGRITVKLADAQPAQVGISAWIIPGTPPANNPPILNPIGNKTATVGQLLQLTISGTDPDGDTLTYAASNLPSGASFNATTQTFTWTPSQAGTFSGIHFSVSDGQLNDSENITITVQAATTTTAPVSTTSTPVTTPSTTTTTAPAHTTTTTSAAAATTPPLTTGTPSVTTQHYLTINITGKGTVTRDPDRPSYTAGTKVHLKAIPAPGYFFCSWSGAISGNANTATITMNSDVTINAIFALSTIPPPTTTTTASANTPPSVSTTMVTTPGVTIINNTTIVINLAISINHQGNVTKDIEGVCVDHRVWLNIPSDTRCLDNNGNVLASVTVQVLGSPPGSVTTTGLIASIYSLTPESAAFSPAAILFFRYDVSSLPPGGSELNIKIVSWDSNTGRWTPLDTLLDTQNHIAFALITHTSYYSLVAAPLPATTAAAAETSTPAAVTTAVATAAAMTTSTVTVISPVTQPAQTQPALTASQTEAAAALPSSTASSTTTTGSNTATSPLSIGLIVAGAVLFIGVVLAMVMAYRRQVPDDHKDKKDKYNPPGGSDDSDNDEEG